MERVYPNHGLIREKFYNCVFFYVFLTVYLSIFISVINIWRRNYFFNF